MIVVNYGMGTNSTALLVEATRRGIIVDLIVTADTGDEFRADVQIQSGLLCLAGGTRAAVRNNDSVVAKNSSFVPISALCLARGDLPSKAYGLSGCTSKWKQQPIDKLVKEHAGVQVAWARGELVERWIGYDAGEPERSERMLAKNPQPTRIRNGKVEMLPRWRWRTPLVEWDMGREECVRAIQDAGLPLPGKSACFHCPSTTKREIDRMVVEEPEMLKRALAIEDNARAGMTSVKGLGRRFSWRNISEGRVPADSGDAPEIECGCFDGAEW